MIEKFRDQAFRGIIKTRYADSEGKSNVWEINQDFLLTKILQIVTTYQKHQIKLTSRQLYYQLVAGDIIPNSDKVYKRVCKFLTDTRYAGLVDWDAIEDRGRVPEKHSEWENVKELIKSACSSYRLPRWENQDYYVELYTEKQAMESVLKPIANKYHIFFGYNKGYSSASTMYDLGKRIKEQIGRGKKCVILYLGDHDPSGLDMIRDIRERITEFCTKGEDPVGELVDYDENGENEEYDMGNSLIVVPVALSMAQIKRYNPPPNPAKITDPRAKWYIAQFGKVSWELDALKPEVLIDLAERSILGYLDADKYNAWIAREQKEKEALQKFGEQMVNGGSK